MPDLTQNFSDLLAELLEVPEIDPDKGFLDLGGTSVLAIRACARIATEHRINLQPTVFLRNLCTREIATLAQSTVIPPSGPTNEAETVIRL